MAERLLTAAEVSEILTLPVDHVYKLAHEDRIPHLRFGRTLRFRSESITEWLEDSEQATNNRRNHR
jgi:excisionase family DNA binding protein